MVIRKQEGISILLKNFIEARNEIEIVFLYSRQGLLISKYGRLQLADSSEDEIDEVHGANTSLVENLLEKISVEYKTGSYGTGSFETPEVTSLLAQHLRTCKPSQPVLPNVRKAVPNPASLP